MIDYEQLYNFLFNGVTDIVTILEKKGKDKVAVYYLKLLQMSVEESYLRMEDETKE